MSLRRLLALVSLTLLLALPSGAEWPQFRGPERSGVSHETGLADSWPEGGPPVVWSFPEAGDGYGSVAVSDGRVHLLGTRGDRALAWALDEETGRRLWEVDLGERLIQDKGDGPRSTPTVVGDDVYVLTGRGLLASLDAASGDERWTVDLLDRFGASRPRWGVSESPLVDGDVLYVMPGGREGSVVALERATGRTLWTSGQLTDRASYSSLLAVDLGGRRTLLGFTQSAGVGLDAGDGELLWRYEAPANATANAATPVYGDGIVFYTSSYGVGGGALRLTPTAGRVEAEEIFFASNLQNHHGGVVLWEGHLYGFFGPALGCVELATGEIKWRARSVGKGSVVVADGKLFMLGEKHRAGLALATPEGYTELGRFEIEDRGLPSWANPAVSGGRLYLRNRGELVAYDVAAPGADATASR